MRFSLRATDSLASSLTRRVAAFGLGASLLLGVVAGCASTKDASADGGAPAAPTTGQQSAGGSSPGRGRPTPLYTRREVVDTRLPDRALVLIDASGPVSVVEGDLEAMVIRAQISATSPERRDAARVSAQGDSQGRFTVSIEWPDGKRAPEASAFEVQLPRGASRVGVRTTGGAVKLVGVRSDAVVRTENGPVTITDHAGAIDAQTTNAVLSFERVQGAIRGVTTNGMVMIRDASGSVDVSTSKAAIDIRMNPGANGPIRATTELGGVFLQVGPGFLGTLTLRTTDSPIVVNAQPGTARVVARKVEETILAFPVEGPESLVQTSGGAIEVRVTDR